MSIEIEAIKAGQQEWEAGHGIVAAALNAFADEKGLEPLLEADPPPDGLTLEECRRRLSGAMTAVKSTLRHHADNDLCPNWTMGNISGKTGKLTSTDEPPVALKAADGLNLDEVLCGKVDLLYALSRRDGLDESKWREHIVEPTEEHARSVRANFAYFEDELRPKSKRAVDKATDARDEFIYDLAIKRTTYPEIMQRLYIECEKRGDWGEITTPNGVKGRAFLYAARQGLTPPEKRR